MSSDDIGGDRPQRPGDSMIRVRGARTHNLKGVDVDIPKHALVVFTGLSGSGKSSLAFDTLYAEGQRRYVESLSTYARQFLQVMDKPDVDVIEGLSPAISIEQKAGSHNPRSTVGTITEIHDYLRLLFARAGAPHCPEHGVALRSHSVSQMVDAALALPEGTRVMLLAPVVRDRKGEFADLIQDLRAQGFVRLRVRVGSEAPVVVDADATPALRRTERHDLDVVVDRLRVRADARQRLAESFETALSLADGRVVLWEVDPGTEHLFNSRFGCPHCAYALPELEPRLFSFNSPIGACPACGGLGQESVFDPERVVAFPALSLAAGAVKGWDRRNAHAFSLLEAVARHAGFDLDTPFESLPESARRLVLYGSGGETIDFSIPARVAGGRGRRVRRRHAFEGVIPQFERRLKETDSPLIREELGRLQVSRPCAACAGTRLRREARHVFLPTGQGSAQGPSLNDIEGWNLARGLEFFDQLRFEGVRGEIAAKVVQEIRARLRFLNDVGLGYLSLDRSADTLSGGEGQRIRLASQIGSGLSGVMYVLDEPSIGLHQRDTGRLIETLRRLRDLGNSVLVVEHDEEMIRSADHVIDIGPGAGTHGGQVVAQGTPQEIERCASSLTGRYLAGVERIARPSMPSTPGPLWQADPHAPVLRVVGARGHNLRDVEVAFPVGQLTCVTGVSGSGKSTLVNDTVFAAVAARLHRLTQEPAPHDRIEGVECFDKVINVDQSPIGRTPRSNPATYTGLFTPIRELFAELPASRERGYGAGRFSFNVAGGRCEACQGDGVLKVEMHFLADVYVTCEVCQGRRYNRETLEVRYKGMNIAEVLAMTVEEAHGFFAAVPALVRRLKTLADVGLGYVRLGQSGTTLSGGEAQRVKLALELGKRDTGRTLYLLDEPTTGLHFHDVRLLLGVLRSLREAGNTIIVIEHHLDVIASSDWIVELGPEGGAGGGRLVYCGPPAQATQTRCSATGRSLAARAAARTERPTSDAR